MRRVLFAASFVLAGAGAILAVSPRAATPGDAEDAHHTLTTMAELCDEGAEQTLTFTTELCDEG